MKSKDATKERKIMDATIDIVHTSGLMGVKMSEVAKEVAISPSNLYIYFKNKEDLLTTTFFDIAKRVVKAFEVPKSDETIFKKRMYSLLDRMLKVKMDNLREFSFMEQFIRSPYFQERHHLQMDSMAKNGLDFLRAGQTDMILKDDVTVHMILAMITGSISKFVELHHKGIIKLDKKTKEKCFRMIWHAIRQ